MVILLYNVVILEIWLSQSSGIVDFACVGLEMSIFDFSKWFLQSVYSLLCVITEISGLFSLSSDSDLTKMSLNVWFQKGM